MEEITNFNLTGREKDILTILWHAEDGMIASDIVKEANGDLTINTVQATLKKLLRRKLIKVKDIVYSGTVLCRRYVPTMCEAEFETSMISFHILGLNRFSISPARFVMGFLNKGKTKLSKEEADELMGLIQKYTEE